MKKMTRLFSFFVALILSIILPTIALAADVYSLTPREQKYLQQRGFNSDDISKLSPSELESLLKEFRNSISLYAAPSNYVKVTNVPTQGTEWFHPSTGLTNGDFFDQDNWFYMLDGPYKFSYMVFGSEIPKDKYMYYLWGEWDDIAKTHQGVDVKYTMASSSSKKEVYSAHEGTITYLDRDKYGVVAIYDGYNTHYYLHLKNIPTSFKKGTYITLSQRIGDQGAVGLSSASAYHVHYEVRSGKQENGPRPTSGLYTDDPYWPMEYNWAALYG